MSEQSVGDAPLLEVRDLKKHYPIRRGLLKRTVGHVRAVDGIDFSIQPRETLALVGESGCGKSTTGYCIMRLLETTGGEILFRDGSADSVHVESLKRSQAKGYLRQVQIIFQNPYSSLDPRMSVADIVAEPLRIHDIMRGRELEERVAYLLQAVGLQARHLHYYPHAFSGGQRQRIGIARALSLQPKMIICDEPVSALDVSIQAQVLNLLIDLQQEYGLTYLFISHDLGVVHHISNRVAVMYVGKIVEVADTGELFEHPLHPYTEALLAAVPKANPKLRHKRTVVRGEVPNPANPPSGCRFHPRCAYAQAICKVEEPALREVLPNHYASCHFAEQLALRGVELG
jgi:peptide/nickel transport system ATP-binding protein